MQVQHLHWRVQSAEPQARGAREKIFYKKAQNKLQIFKAKSGLERLNSENQNKKQQTAERSVRFSLQNFGENGQDEKRKAERRARTRKGRSLHKNPAAAQVAEDRPQQLHRANSGLRGFGEQGKSLLEVQSFER